MRLVLLIALLFLSDSQIFGGNSIYTYDEDSPDKVSFKDSVSVFFEGEKEYSIEEIIHLPDSLFAPLENRKQKMEKETTVWARIQLENGGTKTFNGYFNLCLDIDYVWSYAVVDSVVIDENRLGKTLIPSEKSLPSAKNYIPFSIQKGKTVLFYFKMHFDSPKQRLHSTHVYSFSAQPLIQNLLRVYAWNCFYAGIMLLFSLVSLFMFGVFREKTFIYFALLTFFFAAYFLQIYGILVTFITFYFNANFELAIFFIISGLLISVFLFVSDYIHLQTHFPKYYQGYLILTFLVAVFVYIADFFIESIQLINFFHNIIVIIWVIITIVPIFLLARQKNKPARILLLSLAVLAVGTISYSLFSAYKKSNTNTLTNIYILQVGTIVFSGILFYSLFDKVNRIRNEKRRFEELDHLKSRFFANISHEFRTPLTLVLGPVEQVMKKQKNEQDKTLLQMAHRNAQRLLQLINQLLDLSKLEGGKMELKASKQNFIPLLKGITLSFESYADRKDIRLHFASQKNEIKLYIDPDKIEKIFYNLLSNAIKFTNEQGEIAVLLTEQKEWVEIQVQDSGIGIQASRLPHIFNRFYQVDSSETREQEGTGIGLALVKELVELHKGHIRAESTITKGTTFTILLPKGKKHLKESEILEEVIPLIKKKNNLSTSTILQDDNSNVTPTGLPFNKTLPTVLVIEDHADVRAYIRQYLMASFQVLEAINGQEGIEKALEHLPDLIISDVMMPKKNGYEVCQTLKTDQRTSHIPVILLTAKAAQEEKLEGLETGADDYLVKPFDTKELEVRARNLIEVRRKLRKQFANSPIIEPATIQTNPVDQAFLEKVCTTIEAHLSDEQFGVEVLAEAVGMSRVHLNRKLKALTDQSANKFIRNLRLQKAAELLRQKTGNVSEIAFEVGFSSTSYFVKCFRDKYGVTPGNFLKK
ncbi:MAG: hybrid sensor histidine kinase/response regulator transcription factor [Chitinophagales bacterium]